MKKIIVLFSLLLAFSCEDNNENEDKKSLVGTWEMSNLGEYANADCSGTIDSSEWATMSAFGMKVTMEFTADGKGTYSVSGLGTTQDMPLTWDESKSQICIMGLDCVTYNLNDNKFKLDFPDEAYCEDDNGEDTSHTDESSCEAAGNTWFEKSCEMMEFTKE